MTKQILVFPSNTSGIHSLGMAKEARIKYGAKQGLGEGYWGNSYAFPTKVIWKPEGSDIWQGFPLPDNELVLARDRFVRWCFAKAEKDGQFPRLKICDLGLGLAGFRESGICPLFLEFYTLCKKRHYPVEWGPKYQAWFDKNIPS